MKCCIPIVVAEVETRHDCDKMRLPPHDVYVVPAVSVERATIDVGELDSSQVYNLLSRLCLLRFECVCCEGTRG